MFLTREVNFWEAQQLWIVSLLAELPSDLKELEVVVFLEHFSARS